MKERDDVLIFPQHRSIEIQSYLLQSATTVDVLGEHSSFHIKSLPTSHPCEARRQHYNADARVNFDSDRGNLE